MSHLHLLIFIEHGLWPRRNLFYHIGAWLTSLSLLDSQISLKPLVFFTQLSVLSLDRDDHLIKVLLFLLAQLSIPFELLMQAFIQCLELVVF